MEALDVTRFVLTALGIVAFAISGGLMARKHDMDAVGIIALAVVTATGGGMIRDVLIGALPVAALVELWMIALAIGAGLAVLLFVPEDRKFRKPLLIFDAIGLGLFVVDGTLKGLIFGLHPFAAVGAGVLTAVGGGVIRDVLAQEVPIIFRRASELYVVPALLGGFMVIGVSAMGWGNTITYLAIAVVTLGFRILAIKYRWHLPGARYSPEHGRG